MPSFPNSFWIMHRSDRGVSSSTNQQREKSNHCMLTLLILIYADDVALFAHNMSNLQKLVDAMHAFYEDAGLSINVAKTKFMVVKTHKTDTQPLLTYQEKQIERSCRIILYF